MLRKTAEIKTVLKVYNKLKQLRADLIDTAAVMANECVPKNDQIVLKSWKAEDDLLSMYWKLGEYIYKQTGRTAEELNHEGCRLYPDAVPVRHGKWTRENNYGIWKCSVCGCKVRRENPLKGNIWNYNFCPNCGARMDEE